MFFSKMAQEMEGIDDTQFEDAEEELETIDQKQNDRTAKTKKLPKEVEEEVGE